MGHYDSSYDHVDEVNLKRAREEIKRELDRVSNVNDMYLIRKLVYRREKLAIFFDILNNGLQ